MAKRHKPDPDDLPNIVHPKVDVAGHTINLPDHRFFIVRRYHPTSTNDVIEEIPVMCHYLTPQGDALLANELYALGDGVLGVRTTRGWSDYIDFEEKQMSEASGLVQ